MPGRCDNRGDQRYRVTSDTECDCQSSQGGRRRLPLYGTRADPDDQCTIVHAANPKTGGSGPDPDG